MKNQHAADFFKNSLSIVILGHVDHGKTTLAKALSGKQIMKHSEEIKRGMTIKLGYADFNIYRCKEHGYTNKEICPICNKKTEFVRRISILDAPGHEALTAIMLTGAALVDAAILVIDASDKFPQPQTIEHLIAFKYMKDKPLIIVQNKIDLINKEKAIENYKNIVDLLKKFGIDINKVQIIPISAINEINIEYVLEILANIDIPQRDTESDPIFLCSRSFDINKPGTDINDLKGGVLGGILIRGVLKVGDEIEIKPGIFLNNRWVPIYTKIVSLKQYDMDVESIYPGNTAGIQTTLDPFVTKDDTLAGQVVGIKGKLPEAQSIIEMVYERIDEIIDKDIPFKKGENILIAYYNVVSEGIISEIKDKKIKVHLKKPIIIFDDSRILIIRNINKSWKIYGYGEILQNSN